MWRKKKQIESIMGMMGCFLLLTLASCHSVEKLLNTGNTAHTMTIDKGKAQLKNLAISTNGEHQTHVLFDDLEFAGQSFPGHYQITCDIEAPGWNGLDTGTPMNDTQYAQFIIVGPGKVATVFSLSETDPVLPPGYTDKLLVGFKYRTPDGILRKELQVDDTIYPEVPIAIFTNQTVANDIWTRTFFPPNILPPNNHCWEAEFYGVQIVTYNTTGLRQFVFQIRSSLMYNSERNLINQSVNVGVGDNQQIGKEWFVIDEGAADIYWSNYSDNTGRTAFKTHLYISTYKVRI